MRATQQLRAEHNAVLLALDLLKSVIEKISTKDKAAEKHLSQLLDFFKGFVDLCHHKKEEEVLFPELERRRIARSGGPIGVMLSEHEIGRRHVREMSSALARWQQGDASALSALLSNASDYREMLKAHIFKENNVLFVMAERVIPGEVAEQMFERFEAIEQSEVGEGKHEAYHSMLHQLKELYAASLPGPRPA